MRLGHLSGKSQYTTLRALSSSCEHTAGGDLEVGSDRNVQWNTYLATHAPDDALYKVGADKEHVVLEQLVRLVYGVRRLRVVQVLLMVCVAVHTWIVPLAADEVFEANGSDLAHFGGD